MNNEPRRTSEGDAAGEGNPSQGSIIAVRLMTEADISSAMSVYRSHLPDGAIVEDHGGFNRKDWLGLLSGKVCCGGMGTSKSFVAVEGDSAVVGFVVINVTLALDGKHLKPAEINDICVRASVQRKGVGTMLLRAAFAAAWDAGLREVKLTYNVKNPGGAKLYEKVGFVQSKFFLKLYSAGSNIHGMGNGVEMVRAITKLDSPAGGRVEDRAEMGRLSYRRKSARLG